MTLNNTHDKEPKRLTNKFINQPLFKDIPNSPTDKAFTREQRQTKDIIKETDDNEKIHPTHCELTQPLFKEALEPATKSAFSSLKILRAPLLTLPPSLTLNTRQSMDGHTLLMMLQPNTIPAVFFDPQFRGIYDQMKFGNEKTSRTRVRANLPQMDEATIVKFIKQISRVLIPSGHLFLWIDKFHLCNDFKSWIEGTHLSVVDMVIWDKGRLGLGFRTRRQSEFCVILQKRPKRAKGVWTLRNVPDVWSEKVGKKTHPHQKPLTLQATLIEAVTCVGDLVVDPCAGSYSVLNACKAQNRNFLGCDLQ